VIDFHTEFKVLHCVGLCW